MPIQSSTLSQVSVPGHSPSLLSLATLPCRSPSLIYHYFLPVHYNSSKPLNQAYPSSRPGYSTRQHLQASLPGGCPKLTIFQSFKEVKIQILQMLVLSNLLTHMLSPKSLPPSPKYQAGKLPIRAEFERSRAQFEGITNTYVFVFKQWTNKEVRSV